MIVIDLVYYLFYFSLFLVAFDIFSTLYGLKLGMKEGNPILRKLFKKIKPEIVLSISHIAIIIYLWYNKAKLTIGSLFEYNDVVISIPNWNLSLILLIWGGVAVNNTISILKARKNEK